MELKTALKAIDFLSSQLNSKYRTNNFNDVNISFYGGESLNEFDNLIICVSYAKNHKGLKDMNMEFNITTNGLLLTPEISKKLIEHDFLIDISLDGPAEEHDRFRVMANGEKTWKRIMRNVKYIKSQFPDYFKSRIRFFVTIHPQHDIKKIEDFFLGNPDFFNEENVVLNRVNLLGLIKSKKLEWKNSLKQQVVQIHTELDKSKWFYRKYVTQGIEDSLGVSGTRILYNITSFTGTCFPGGVRLYVDVNGRFHICEKINHHLPIGNVDSGYDLKKIKSLVDQWRREIVKSECWKCDVLHLCTTCFAKYNKKYKISIDKNECKKFVKNNLKTLSYYLSLKEMINEELLPDSYDSIPDFLESLQQ